MAVARKGIKSQIQLLDTQNIRPKKSTMALSEEQAKLMPDFYYLSISNKEDRMAALSNHREPVVSYWEIDSLQSNIKLLSVYSLKEHECLELMICPIKSDIISVIGKDNFRILKFYDDSLKQSVSSILSRKEISTSYVCHTWLCVGSVTPVSGNESQS